MALVRALHQLDSERSSLHEEVEARFTSFTRDGRAFFQINTYGRPHREVPGKVSQTIQLDRDAAIQLIGLLKTAFSLD